MTVADIITMLINCVISFWVFFPIMKIIFKEERSIKTESYCNRAITLFLEKIFIFVLLCFVTGTLTTTLNTIQESFYASEYSSE